MDEIEVIAKQAIKIEELNEENEILKKIINSIHMELISIGAPLNDNVDGYTNQQLKIFFRIEELLHGNFKN